MVIRPAGNGGGYNSGLMGYYKYDSAFTKATKEAQSMFEAFTTNDEVELEKIWSEYIDTRNRILADTLGMKYERIDS